MNGKFVHLFPFLFLFSLLAPVSGFRHIWQDEAETAERARSILHFGVPKTTDPEGRLSVNTGGLEVEETDLHRYTPWLQFYLGAVGLGLGRKLHLNDDASLRLPSIALHGMTSSLLSYGLAATFGIPPPASAFIATLFGVQSVRVLHNRSARYHALLDFLFLIALLASNARFQERAWVPWIASAAIFAMPWVHTLGGSLLSSALVLTLLCESKFCRRSTFLDTILNNMWKAIVPLLVSLLLLVLFCRPQLHGFFSVVDGPKHFRSLKSGFEISYAFYPFLVAIIYLFWRESRATAMVLGAVLIYLFAAGRILDFYPFSQPRYYLSLPIFLLFWPLLLGGEGQARPRAWIVCFIYVLLICLPEFQGVIRPFQGLRVILADWRMQNAGVTQPMTEAIHIINDDPSKSAVAVDYVPQLANWYFRDRPVALVPDRSSRTPLNTGRPMWSDPIALPGWHLFYAKAFNGHWNCSPHCDIRRENYSDDKDKYDVVFGASGKRIEMCVIKRWPTALLNNAPIKAYPDEAVNPEGKVNDLLVLAKRCR